MTPTVAPYNEQGKRVVIEERWYDLMCERCRRKVGIRLDDETEMYFVLGPYDDCVAEALLCDRCLAAFEPGF